MSESEQGIYDCGPKIVAPNDFCNYGKRKEN